MGKQAIILIHGIGEQRPMETATAFANTIANAENISYRPSRFGLHGEVNRISIKATSNRPATDIYEYYWAHEFRDNKLSTIHNWFFHLFLSCLRKLCENGSTPTPGPLIPKELLIVLLGSLYLFFWIIGISSLLWAAHSLFTFVALAVSALLAYKLLLSNLFFGYLADAAKYLSNHPDNVAARGRVRTGAMELLHGLHESPDYDRIIVVGHSLGSVIGIDAITQYWLKKYHSMALNGTHMKKVRQRHEELMECGETFDDKVHSQFQKCQRRMREELNAEATHWKVSDFVSAGSPLSFANFLIAKNDQDFVFKRERTPQISMCPPLISKDERYFKEKQTISTGEIRDVFYPAAATLFIYTRWTNIYGNKDLVGGQISPLFGKGVFDMKAESSSYLSAHTEYFNGEKNKIANQLKSALKLDVGLQS